MPTARLLHARAMQTGLGAADSWASLPPGRCGLLPSLSPPPPQSQSLPGTPRHSSVLQGRVWKCIFPYLQFPSRVSVEKEKAGSTLPSLLGVKTLKSSWSFECIFPQKPCHKQWHGSTALLITQNTSAMISGWPGNLTMKCDVVPVTTSA